MSILIHPAYFPAITTMAIIAQSEQVLFEKCDNFQKQTFRNRMYIYSPNGKQMLSIPIKHLGINGRQLYRDVRIENDFQWQKQHWKSLEAAYRTSPFFEFYEDEIVHLFEKKHDYLYDLNIATFTAISDCLQIEPAFKFTEEFNTDTNAEIADNRKLIIAKTAHPNLEPYPQVFQEKHGFINNLSTLDLLFNEGPNALTYLESISL